MGKATSNVGWVSLPHSAASAPALHMPELGELDSQQVCWQHHKGTIQPLLQVISFTTAPSPQRNLVSSMPPLHFWLSLLLRRRASVAA